MKKLGFIFRSSPHSTSSGREGLDALLAASAYCEDIAVFFVEHGVAQIIANQSPQEILQRDYISAFKLIDLYDIKEIYICEQDIEMLGLADAEWVIEAQKQTRPQISELLQQCDQILTF